MQRLFLFFCLCIPLTSCFKEDTVAPSISLTEPTTMDLLFGSEYQEPGYLAEDNRDGKITQYVEVSGYVDIEQAGINHLYYNVTDASGNAAFERIRYVRVKHHPLSIEGIYSTIDSCNISVGTYFTVLEPSLNLQKTKIIGLLNQSDTLTMTANHEGLFGEELNIETLVSGDTIYSGKGYANSSGNEIAFSLFRKTGLQTDTCRIYLSK